MGDASPLDRVTQRLTDVRLPDDVVKRLRTVTAGEDGVGSGHGVRAGGRMSRQWGLPAGAAAIIPVSSGRAKRGAEQRQMVS